MRSNLVVLIFLSLLVFAACGRTETTQVPANQAAAAQSPNAAVSSPAIQPAQQPSTLLGATQKKPKTDACALLTSKEVESVQGEAIKETKLSGSSDGGFSVSQCFFTLPTFTNSISLSVTQKGDDASARDPREFWKQTFGQKREDDKKGERDREKPRAEGEEEKSVPPQRIDGIGNEAFWMGSRVGGALYVLKGNNYVRISIGGAGDQMSKIKRSKALAQRAIARL